MTFPGRFADSLVVEQLDKLSLSFLVEELDVRRGGVAANIAFGMGNLGLRPLLVGAVGPDFVDYRAWLERHGVDCAGVHTSFSSPREASPHQSSSVTCCRPSPQTDSTAARSLESIRTVVLRTGLR